MYSTRRIKAIAAAFATGVVLASLVGSAQAAGRTPRGLTASQLKGIEARALATDQYYHLGKFSPTATALRAERLRAQATDRFYHLGRYAVPAAASPFRWADAGIGAGAMLGAILLVGGTTVALRRRDLGKTSSRATS
jgi:hypothetical protein